MTASLLVLGGGKIGAVVAELLAHAETGGRPDYRVTVADRSAAARASASVTSRRSAAASRC